MTLHLANYIKKEIARIRRDECVGRPLCHASHESSDDASLDNQVRQNHQPGKRQRTSENPGNTDVTMADPHNSERATRSKSRSMAAV